MTSNLSVEVLSYSVIDSSGYSANYRPENILQNEPAEQASRWSSASNDQNQFLLLKLDKMALLEFISFGKFHKVHVCNLKEFKVYGGLDPSNLRLILHSGLNNDTEPESFPLDWNLIEPINSQAQREQEEVLRGQAAPIQYLKIVPLAAWGSNFNYSLWYIELRGWSDDGERSAEKELLGQHLAAYQSLRETCTTRQVLKFLRDHHYDPAFQALQDQTRIALEDPRVTQLYELLNQKGPEALVQAERLLSQLFVTQPDIFDEFLRENVPYIGEWKRLDPDGDGDFAPLASASGSGGYLDENGDFKMTGAGGGGRLEGSGSAYPCPRGGHQMALDPESRTMYLLGGWDGQKDLGDFWKSRLTDDDGALKWELISENTEREGGPCARSCHKMAVHSREGTLYVLGRYIEPEQRRGNTGESPHDLSLPADFYRYDCRSGSEGGWERLSGDVRVEGGPSCIYDHQMVIDEDRNLLWVFGGRCLSLNSGHAVASSGDGSAYSGLFCYEIETRRWKQVRCDPLPWVPSKNPLPTLQIPARIGHSMLFDPLARSLLILSGQRFKDYLGDFYRYSVDRDVVTHYQKNLQLCGGPDAGFTQRASIDPQRREMFVFSGLMRANSTSNNTTTASNNNNAATAVAAAEAAATPSMIDSSCFWCFDFRREKWSRIYSAASVGAAAIPSPRYAHQIVYDPQTQTHYLFGGNPGISSEPSQRLNDFWRVKIRKPLDAQDVLRRCQYALRRAIFEGLLQQRSLGSSLASAVSPLQALHYLQNDLSQVVNHADPQESHSFRLLSTKLFESNPAATGNENPQSLFNEIVRHLPRDMQPPQASL